VRHLLPVRIDSAWFGFDALDVEEILTVSSCVSLPVAGQAAVGVLRWRGQALAVVDIGSGAATLAPRTMRSRVVVVRVAGGGTIAVPVTAVQEVRERSGADPPMIDVPAVLGAIAGHEALGARTREQGGFHTEAAPGRPGGDVNLVTISSEGFDYALLTDVVRAIVSPRDWTGPEPFDFAEIAHNPRPRGAARERLVVVSAAGRELALRVAGAVAFRQLEASQLLPLPRLSRGRASEDLFDRIAFLDDQPPLLLLNPAAFPAASA